MEALLNHIPSECIRGVTYKMSPINLSHYETNVSLGDIIKPRLDRKKYRLVQDVCVLTSDNTELSTVKIFGIYPDIPMT